MHVITASRKDSLFRKARVALGALLLTLAGGVLAGERLHIFTEFAHSADEITGICTDMVKAILARTDFDYVMKVRAWSYVFDRVQGRPNHGLFCTARTEDREGLFQWVGPLASIKWTLFAAPDSDLTLERLEDARPLRIAGYKGDVMSQYLVDQGFNVIMSLSGDLNPQRLVLGQADLWVTDGLVGPLVARETQGIEGLRPVLVFRETPMYLAMSKETDPAIVAKLQNALDAARAAGELDAIQARYE
jgi:polar amino acid transport system substrate-binding protein